MNHQLSASCALGIASLGIWLSGTAAAAVDKEISLVTKQALGELAVAGRLSIDLHAEFMLSRSWETETALNWFNCGYSGGGGGGTDVGGNFGFFGFQVPFAERELRYPRAVTLDQVPAVGFDGDDFLKGNFIIESKILDTGCMAVELWFRAEEASPATVILGWQALDGRESSAPLGYPPGFKGSTDWRHLVVNCAPQQEDWYLDGVKVASGPRRMLVEPGHVMILGGAVATAPSFKGELAAVRLHDEAMSEAEISHNFKGGVMLGTEMHNWWRTEPGKWWSEESSHFRHAVDEEEMKGWTEKQRKEFDGRLPEMFELAELCYHTYSERLAMRSSVVSVQPAERGDGIKYKVPIQPSEGSWMGFDDHFGWACQGAGFINPHELVHGWQVMTGGMAGNYWEVHANFPQTYFGVYQTIPVIMAEASSFPANGRTYYHDRTMFEHLAQTPAYGPMFIAKLWYDGPTPENKSPYPWQTFERINPYADRTLADEFTRMAMRNVTWDYRTFKEFKPGENYRPLQPAADNIYRKHAEANRTDALQSLLRSRVLLKKIPHDPTWWRVPKEQAPQQLGWNICPLEFTPGKVSAQLEGYLDAARGGDWRAGFVGVDGAGHAVYGDVFQPGSTHEFEANAGLKELYLVVCATPARIVDIPMTGDFRSFEQEPFPYKLKLTGCQPLDALRRERPQATGKPHPNGGGLVADSARVDATAFVGPDAQVLGKAEVRGEARIEDQAVVRDAIVKDRAVVSGHALVCENSIIENDAKVRDFAVVKGRTTVAGQAKILEHAVIATERTCADGVVVKGVASVYGGNQSGTAMIDGFYAKGNEITQGKWFTWSWGQGKNPGEVDENFGGLYADYEFNESHDWMARDSFGATWGYLVNRPTIEPRSGASPSAGALRLNGRDQFVELPRDIADMRNCTYTAEVFWDGAAAGERIFEFANANGDMLSLTPSTGSKMVCAIRKDGRVETVSAPALPKGVWTTVQVMFDADRATLYVNGTKVAENAKMTLKPDRVRATHCFLGRGLKGDYFSGLIGRFTVHSVALVDQSPPLPDPAEFAQPPMFTSPGSLVMAARRGSDPLGVVEYWFEEEGGKWNSGWCEDPIIQVSGRDAAKPLLYRVKTRDKCGNETQFSAPFRVAGFPKDARVLVIAADGPAVIEAEQCFAAIPGDDGTTAWEKRADVPGFAGEGYMVVSDRGQVNDPFSASFPRLDYAMNFTKPGRYFLWVRANGNNDGGASIHAGFGLTAAPWGTNLRTGHGRYAWTRSPAFQIAKAGEYIFSIWMREDGAMMDRLMITADESYEPSPDQRAADKTMTGKGPPLSKT